MSSCQYSRNLFSRSFPVTNVLLRWVWFSSHRATCASILQIVLACMTFNKHRSHQFELMHCSKLKLIPAISLPGEWPVWWNGVKEEKTIHMAQCSPSVSVQKETFRHFYVQQIKVWQTLCNEGLLFVLHSANSACSTWRLHLEPRLCPCTKEHPNMH